MLNRNFGKNANNAFVTRDEDHNSKRQPQTATTPGASYDAPANPTLHQPYSPSVLLAGGDKSFFSDPAFFPAGTRSLQDTDMEAQGCNFIAANLSAYLDGELDSDQARLVGAHLKQCPHCAEILEAMSTVDETIEREWRESTPLPSSLHFDAAIDNIMDALPSVPVEAVAFAAHRVHARTRWMRFATGIAGAVAVVTSLWSSYWLGYSNGRRSIAAPGSVSVNPFKRMPDNSVSSASLLSTSAPKRAIRLTPASFLLPASASTTLLHPPRLPVPLTASAFSHSARLTRSGACP